MKNEEMDVLAYDLLEQNGDQPMRDLLGSVYRLTDQQYKEADANDFSGVWAYNGQHAAIYLKHLKPLIEELNELGTFAEWIRDENKKWY